MVEKGWAYTRGDRSNLGKPPTRPSRTQLSVAATLAISALSFALVFGPRKSDTALAADPARIFHQTNPTLGELEQLLLSRNISPSEISDSTRRNEREEVGQVYPLPSLKKLAVKGTADGRLTLPERPSLDSRIGDRFASLTPNKNFVFYTVDPELQDFVSSLTANSHAKHVAIVAMNPRTGAILALAGKSDTINDVEYHSDFPAASLFKVVTASAAVEQAGIQPHSLVSFRGGTYTLNESNYYPDPRRDNRIMSVGEALGRSCNPVFGHLGVKYLNGSILQKYSRLFGFNRSLLFEAPLSSSSAEIPSYDQYELSRTAAGFGDVRISPIHAAVVMSGIANEGLLPRPHLVAEIVARDGEILNRTEPDILNRAVQPSTAASVMEMMRYTTTVGTSRREFMRGARPTLGNIEVVGKTGTLKGDNPVGLNNWFIGSAPLNNPELSIAVITVDAAHSGKASRLARRVFEKYFNVEPAAEEPVYSSVRHRKSSVRRAHPARSKASRVTKKPAKTKASPKKSSTSYASKSKKPSSKAKASATKSKTKKK